MSLQDLVSDTWRTMIELGYIKGDSLKYICKFCGGPQVQLRSMNERVCNDCKKSEPWNLNEGQKPLLNTSRGDRKNA